MNASTARLRALLDLSHALSSSLEMREVLRLFQARAVELTGATACELSLWDAPRDLVVQLTDWSAWLGDEHPGYSEAGESYELGRFPEMRRCLERAEAVEFRVAAAAADPELARSLAAYGIGTSLMLPLRSAGETFALMEVVDVADRTFATEDVEFCRALCDVVAPFIRNAMLYDEYRSLAMRDDLTGLGNRRDFEDRLAAAVERWRRDGSPLALLVLDVDDLKAINDAGGHEAGDAALRLTARALAASIRGGDVACRTGGDEFAVLLPGASSRDAVAVAARAQRTLAVLSAGSVGFSGGVASAAEAGDAATLYRIADRAAYAAKRAGRTHTRLAA